jgi:hypothetical protein
MIDSHRRDDVDPVRIHPRREPSMALSAFPEKARKPSERDLRSVMGAAYPSWARLIKDVASEIAGITELWAFTSKSTGWGLRLRHGERVILYMTPCEGHFLVSFALGEKAVAQAHAAKLSKELLSAIDAAPRYAEGRGLRLQVTDISQIAPLVALAQIKHG